jgi:hypothetical protein
VTLDIGSTPPLAGMAEYDLVEVAAAMRSLSQRVAQDDGHHGPVQRLVEVAVERVPGARWASVSMLRGSRFSTAASTGEQAVRADVLQYELGSGPFVDAVLRDSPQVAGELCRDSRWSDWGRRASSEVGVNSVLSQRLPLPDQRGVVAGLNLYCDAHDAFDQVAVGVALILATHGGVALAASLTAQRAGDLSRALLSNREIGVAMGILMHHRQVTRDEAFDALREASQSSNRRLADIATEVVDTGTLSIIQHEV